MQHVNASHQMNRPNEGMNDSSSSFFLSKRQCNFKKRIHAKPSVLSGNSNNSKKYSFFSSDDNRKFTNQKSLFSLKNGLNIYSPVEPKNMNRQLDDDPIHTPLIDSYRQSLEKEGVPVSHQPGDAQIKYRGLAVCPLRTTVESTRNITPIALRQGWRTAYGIAAVMRTEPVNRNWDGTPITESVSTVSNTCPSGVANNACTGSSTFTVGAPGRSARIGQLQAQRNRFYDFHISKWRTGSLLHDRTRNPRNINSCTVVCNQTYSCLRNVIGRHRITRNYSKGVYNGNDVTIVNVTKT